MIPLVSTIEELIKQSNQLVATATHILNDNRAKRNTKTELEASLSEALEKHKEAEGLHDLHIRSLALMGTATDESVANTINKITGVINKALAVLFPNDRRAIAIKQKLYRNTYSHFEVVLETGAKGRKRSFEMSGTGLAQVVSFLFVMSFIDISGGRKIIVMDEILNGLHPKAKGIIRELMEAVSNRFQFVAVEHNIDLGKQYEVLKNAEVATVHELQEGKYYQNFVLKGAGLLNEEDGNILTQE